MIVILKMPVLKTQEVQWYTVKITYYILMKLILAKRSLIFRRFIIYLCDINIMYKSVYILTIISTSELEIHSIHTYLKKYK